MAKKTSRAQIAMECTECKNRNYYTEKNKVKTTVRLELKKFCSHCKKITTHKEGK